jgi:putative sigma-54 modulation protein
MTIQITGTNIEVTDGIKTHTEDQFEKLNHKFSGITRTSVVVSLDGHQQKAEGNIHYAGQDFNAVSTTDDLYASIDDVARKLEHQMQKHKEKMMG